MCLILFLVWGLLAQKCNDAIGHLNYTGWQRLPRATRDRYRCVTVTHSLKTRWYVASPLAAGGMCLVVPKCESLFNGVNILWRIVKSGSLVIWLARRLYAKSSARMFNRNIERTLTLITNRGPQSHGNTVGINFCWSLLLYADAWCCCSHDCKCFSINVVISVKEETVKIRVIV